MKKLRLLGPPALVDDQIAGKIFRTDDQGKTKDNGKTAGSSDVTIPVDFQGS